MDELQPRWLNRRAAANYLSVQPNALKRLVREGRIPEPTYHLGPRSPRWDRVAIDEAFGLTTKAQQQARADAAIKEVVGKIYADAEAKKRRRQG